jgi:hypothetical protein
LRIVLYAARSVISLYFLPGHLNPYCSTVGCFSHNSPRKRVLELHGRSREAIWQCSAGSKSQITLFFDVWTADGKLPVLGVCCNMVDTDYKQQLFLLALPEIKEPAQVPILPKNCYDSLMAFSPSNDLEVRAVVQSVQHR